MGNGKLIKISNSFIRKKDKKKFNKNLIKEFVVEDIFWLDGKEKMHYDFEYSHVDQKFWNAYEDASGNILDDCGMCTYGNNRKMLSDDDEVNKTICCQNTNKTLLGTPCN